MESKKIVLFGVIASICFVTVLLLFIINLVYSVKKKRLAEINEFELKLKNKELEKMAAVVQAQEQERAKIARNLHDEVGAVLAMANRNLKCTVQKVPEDVAYREDLLFTLEILEQSVDKIRSISHNMIPHFLVKFGLVKTLKRLVEQTEKALGSSCTFDSKLIGDLVINQQHEINFYSIILELLNNLLKHSHPKSVHLILEKNASHLLLKMKHDGIAISQSEYEYLLQHGDGMGLESIALRLKMINGELLYQRDSPGGTIILSMPLTETNSTDEKVDLQKA
jgi:signal transduction histidine kinase